MCGCVGVWVGELRVFLLCHLDPVSSYFSIVGICMGYFQFLTTRNKAAIMEPEHLSSQKLNLLFLSSDSISSFDTYFSFYIPKRNTTIPKMWCVHCCVFWNFYRRIFFFFCSIVHFPFFFFFFPASFFLLFFCSIFNKSRTPMLEKKSYRLKKYCWSRCDSVTAIIYKRKNSLILWIDSGCFSYQCCNGFFAFLQKWD